MAIERQTEICKGALGLRVCRLSKRYRRAGQFWRGNREFHATSQVSLEIAPGKTLALIGSSGSGKSTLARCITRLERPDEGEIWLGDIDIARLGGRDLRLIRSRIQLIFQDPVTAMNPRMSALQVIEEPLLIQGCGNPEERKERGAQLMMEVGLSPDWLNRRITEFSGGQKQRVALARALTIEPKCLVLDEALSGLDLATQSQVADLLLQLQTTHSLTYLLISHDLTLVARMANSTAVMAAGRIVEQGPTSQMLSHPTEPETRALVASSERLEAALALARGASA